MISRKLITRCMMVLCLSVLTMRAQPSGGQREVEFSCISWNGLPSETLYYWDGSAHQPVELKKYKHSPAYKTVGDQFYLFVERTNRAGEKVYQRLARAPFAKESSKMLYVIKHRGKGEGLKVQIMGIDDSLAAFPKGSFRFINLMNHKIMLRFDDKRINLASRRSRVVSVNGSVLGGYMPFLVGNKQGEIILETQIFHQPAGRKLVFIGPSDRGRVKPTVKYFTEIVRPSENVNPSP